MLAPPESMPLPPIPEERPESRVEFHEMLIETFFHMMTADDGVIDFDEFRAWLVSSPPPSRRHGDHHGHKGGKHEEQDINAENSGILIAGKDDLAGLPEPSPCSADLTDSELRPQEENYYCRETGSGNLIFRTICNSEKGEYSTAAVNLPEGRVAACFGLEALRGKTAFAIGAEDGSFTWNSTMGKESFSDLELAGPGVFYIRTIGGSREGSVTVRFVDAPKK